MSAVSAYILFKDTKQRYEVLITWKKITSPTCTTEVRDLLKKNIYLIMFLYFYIIYE